MLRVWEFALENGAQSVLERCGHAKGPLLAVIIGDAYFYGLFWVNNARQGYLYFLPTYLYEGRFWRTSDVHSIALVFALHLPGVLAPEIIQLEAGGGQHTRSYPVWEPILIYRNVSELICKFSGDSGGIGITCPSGQSFRSEFSEVCPAAITFDHSNFRAVAIGFN
jgi:hypothetical protein